MHGAHGTCRRSDWSHSLKSQSLSTKQSFQASVDGVPAHYRPSADPPLSARNFALADSYRFKLTDQRYADPGMAMGAPGPSPTPAEMPSIIACHPLQMDPHTPPRHVSPGLTRAPRTAPTRDDPRLPELHPRTGSFSSTAVLTQRTFVTDTELQVLLCRVVLRRLVLWCAAVCCTVLYRRGADLSTVLVDAIWQSFRRRDIAGLAGEKRQ